MSFSVPSWSAKPQCSFTLRYRHDPEKREVPMDKKPYYTFGRNGQDCDVELGEGCNDLHAAVVHHETGKIYVIDLASRLGTYVNNAKIEKHKPTRIKDGMKLTFGSGESSTNFTAMLTETDQLKGGGDLRASKRSREEESGTVQVLHLLVKHRDSRRPSSWKEEVITRSKEEAMDLVKQFREWISQADDIEAAFRNFASKESDCSSAKRGGDLGHFGRGKMQPPFEKASFALSPGELSEPVLSDSGAHIIYRVS